MPVLSAELFSALLTMVAVYVAVEAAPLGIALLGLVLLIFQYLVGELLKSKQRGEELQRIATTDELTGLANRERFRATLEEGSRRRRQRHESFGVMLIDLDRFKEINDTLGHHYGDVLLRDLGPAAGGVRSAPEGLVARLGGDEFAVLAGRARRASRRARGVRCAAASAASSSRSSSTSCRSRSGRASGSRGSRATARIRIALLRCADMAMYAAKEAHTGYKVYAAAHDQHSVRRLSVLCDFRRALAPTRSSSTTSRSSHMDEPGSHGAEGLVRWQHPEHGLLPPSDFLGIVEQTGLIRPLTRQVLERSIAQCARWRQAGRRADGGGQPVGAQPARPRPALADRRPARRSTA